jgi:antibiotic biosynthesis monooxygenase (ABM) superfamily enzyme
LKGENVMDNTRIINIVATECSPEKDAAFNSWYNDIHIPMLLKYKGIKKVTRYKMIEDNAQKLKYVAIYEYESMNELTNLSRSQEFRDAIAEMQQSMLKMGFEIKSTFSYVPLKTWER